MGAGFLKPRDAFDLDVAVAGKAAAQAFSYLSKLHRPGCFGRSMPGIPDPQFLPFAFFTLPFALCFAGEPRSTLGKCSCWLVNFFLAHRRFAASGQAIAPVPTWLFLLAGAIACAAYAGGST
jgi:hypothetical protein